MTKQSADVYTFAKRGEYVTFMLFEQPRKDEPHTGYFALAIESSFGGFAYAWSHLGVSFRKFLCRLEPDYVGKKMCSGEQKVFDAEATQKYIREQIVDWRRTYSSSAKGKKEAARRTWVDVEDIECPTTFSEWAENQKLFDEAWEMSVYGPGRRTIEFKALYELFWPMLCEALGKELESEQAAEVGVGAAE